MLWVVVVDTILIRMTSIVRFFNNNGTMNIAQNLTSYKINWAEEAEIEVPNFEVSTIKGARKHPSVAESLASHLLVPVKPKVEKVKHLCDDGSSGLREISKGSGMKNSNSCAQIKTLAR